MDELSTTHAPGRIARVTADVGAWLVRVLCHADDSDEVKRRKVVITITTLLLFQPMCLFMFWLFTRYGAIGAGLSVLVTSLSSTAMVLINLPRRSDFLLTTHVTGVNTLFGATLICVLLGGLAPSGFLILWALATPLVAACIMPLRTALWYAAGATCTPFVCALIEANVALPTYLPERVRFGLSLLNSVSISCFAMGSMIYFISQRDQAIRMLAAEQQKSERLLLNILPVNIAARLKAGEAPIADRIPHASVLFADMAGFTPMSARLSPETQIALLGEVFSLFDELSSKYHLEKIKIIGDCYMVAAGVSEPRPDHARVLAMLALEMRDAIARRTFAGEALQFRIGIHSGPVVAGVIGKSKIAYDLYGDTVNTASRMESHGVPNSIHVTDETYRELSGEFHFEPRGEIAVKGKGNLRTWFLLGQQATASTA